MITQWLSADLLVATVKKHDAAQDKDATDELGITHVLLPTYSLVC